MRDGSRSLLHADKINADTRCDTSLIKIEPYKRVFELSIFGVVLQVVMVVRDLNEYINI